MSQIKLDLPFPVSVNSLFFNRAQGSGHSGRGRVKTDAYRAWLSQATLMLPNDTGRISGRYAVAIYIERKPDKRRRDLANFEKGIGDFLVDHDLIDDDSECQLLIMAWSKDIIGCQVQINGLNDEQ